MGDTSMLCSLSMTSALPASWRAVISLLEQSEISFHVLQKFALNNLKQGKIIVRHRGQGIYSI